MSDPPRQTPEADAGTVASGDVAPSSVTPSATPSSASGAGTTGSASSSARSSSSSSSSGRSGGDRSRFDAFELAIVLSHYDIGPIATIKDFPRGSRKAPKLLLRSDRGRFLLKRRARGRDQPKRVAFCHAIQLQLADRQFPLPHLIGTRRKNNSMFVHEGRVYELFEYIKGTGYDQSLDATHDAGRVLGLFHKLLADHEPDHEPASGTYHDARSVRDALDKLPQTLQQNRQPPPTAGEYARFDDCAAFLRDAYARAVEQVEGLGLSKWPKQIVHGDWHPGNMLFRGKRVVAVIDYDSARLAQRIIDIANGALQFSITATGDDPDQWPDYLDESRLKRFLRGYDSVYNHQPARLLSSAELQAMPWLMSEALIAESAIPIAATGSFSYMSGPAFLDMVQRKVHWLHEHANALATAIDQ